MKANVSLHNLIRKLHSPSRPHPPTLTRHSITLHRPHSAPWLMSISMNPPLYCTSIPPTRHTLAATSTRIGELQASAVRLPALLIGCAIATAAALC